MGFPVAVPDSLPASRSGADKPGQQSHSGQSPAVPSTLQLRMVQAIGGSLRGLELLLSRLFLLLIATSARPEDISDSKPTNTKKNTNQHRTRKQKEGIYAHSPVWLSSIERAAVFCPVLEPPRATDVHVQMSICRHTPIAGYTTCARGRAYQFCGRWGVRYWWWGVSVTPRHSSVSGWPASNDYSITTTPPNVLWLWETTN